MIPTNIENENTFRIWVQRAKEGDVAEYFRGHLVRDRDQSFLTKPGSDFRGAGTIGAFARGLYDAGLVRLFQKRMGDDDYIYLAIRTQKLVNDADKTPAPLLIAA